MSHVRTAIAISAVVLLAACGTPEPHDATPSPTTPAPRPAPTSVLTRVPPPVATPPATDPSANPTPAQPRPTLSPDERLERAPIDDDEIIVRESSPPQYAVRVRSGLPSGCHTFDSAVAHRTANDITIDVENRVRGSPNTACTAIYGTHEQIVELGTDFTSGMDYVVHVNDRTLVLHAQ